MIQTSNYSGGSGRLLAFAVSSPVSAYHFLEGQLAFLREAGFRVALLTANDGRVREWARKEGAEFFEIPIVREPAPIKDLHALIVLVLALRRLKPFCFVYGTPKASLLSAVGAALVGVPRRVYLVHGLRFEGFAGWRRRLLILGESLNCVFSTNVVCVSDSVREGLLREAFCKERKVVVLGAGSPNGVDGERFRLPSTEWRERTRAEFGVPLDARLGLFVGRLNPDKGPPVLSSLARAFDKLDARDFLIVAGPIEKSEDIVRELDALENSRRCILAGPVDDVERLYGAADYLLLPTKREGLPTVVIEAGATGLACVASRVTGCIDAVEDGVTGVLVLGNDVAAWQAAIEKVCSRGSGAISSPSSIREKTLRLFSRETVWNNWLEFFNDLDD